MSAAALPQAEKVDIDLSVGTRLDARKLTQSEAFYDLKVFGRQFASGKRFDSLLGPEFSYTQIDKNKASEFLGALPITLKLTRSAGDLNAGSTEALGNFNPFIRGLRDLGLRGAAYFGSDEDLRNWKGALGLETHAYSLVSGRPKAWLTSWVVFGLAYQKREDTDSALLDVDGAVGTYRAYIAQSVAQAARVTKETVSQKLTERLDTVEKLVAMDKAKLVQGGSKWDALAKDYLESLKAKMPLEDLANEYENSGLFPLSEPPSTPLLSAKLSFFLAATDELTEDSVIEKANLLAKELKKDMGHASHLEKELVRVFLEGGFKALVIDKDTLDDEDIAGLNQAMSVPIVTFSAGSVGWYDSSKGLQGDRFKQLFLAGFDLYPKPGNYSMLLRFRYENGFEKSADAVRINRFSITASLKF